MAELTHLFSPITIGTMTLKNRIVLLPTALGYTEGGRPSPRLTAYLEERARGGAGILETPCNIYPSSEGFEGGFIIDASDEAHIPAFRELTDRIHRHGAKIAGQLITLVIWRRDKDAPYELGYPSLTAMRHKQLFPVREMTVEDIEIFIRQYAEAARILRDGGFDAVEIMGGVGATISRFMSPLANLRTDAYGGSFEKRMRLPLEMMEAIRKTAGEDFPILWRYSGHEFMEGGYDIDGAIEIGRALEAGGAKWLNLQVGWHDSSIPLTTKEVPQGHWVYIAERIKKHVGIPVVTTYRITDPVMADRIVAEGRADLVGMARALFADPEWPNKAREGRLDEINRCICCCRCIDQVVSGGRPLEVCGVNPRLGPELETTIEPAARKKKVLVVGAGVAGMEAALVAAQRGHEVTVWEKEDKPGGLIAYAAVPPHKEEVSAVAADLARRLAALGVAVVYNREATAEAVAAEKPDTVVVAVGSRPLIPFIPGIDGPNVVTALDLLGGTKDVGKNVIIVGGGSIGCETASYLLERGHTVTIVEMLPKIGIDIGASERFITIQSLRTAGARLEAGAKVTAITAEGVAADRDGEELFFPADSVVIAAGMEACGELEKALRGTVSELVAVGDCTAPKRVGDAIKAAYRAAREI